jgi:hypothetical protein
MCLIPFTADLLIKGHDNDMEYQRPTLNTMFLISILVLFYIEYVNYRMEGSLKKYFTSDNIVDITMLSLMLVVVIIRFINHAYWVPDDKL